MSKKLYIYEYVSRITTNFHDGGALVIVTSLAPDEAWQEYLRRCASGDPSNAVYLDAEQIIQELPPADRVIDVADSEPDEVYVFQDAGCC